MRWLLAVTVCAALASGCESMNQKIAESRQDRCERADWAQVGERDGLTGPATLADRYQYICGELFKPEPYKEGYDKGFARRPAKGGS